jgi:transcriptional regulator with XRE-family HTH domain
MPSKCTLNQTAFGERLRRWRCSRGLSQAEFGALLHPKARYSTVSCWENGVRRPSLKFLGQILALTRIPAYLALAPTGSAGVSPARRRPRG